MKKQLYIIGLLFTIIAQTQTYYTQPIVSTTPYLGQKASGTLEIFLSSSFQIENPLIVVEGFDSGLLGIENPYGENDLSSFFRSFDTESSDLDDEIDNYDIIYVNWENGNDYLERNAELLKEIIDWVNDNKEPGADENVVIGQSMGGVIARYALADMEVNNEIHDTKLFVSHDAPHQGANIPLSIQYFARHLVDQFISTPLGDMNINITNNGGAVSINDIKNLLNAPGTKQLLSNYIDSSFDLDNTEFDAWQNKLHLKGYPTQTRNIAISNGNHCANTQIFNPGDELFSLNGNAKTGVLSDFLIQLLKPLNILNDLSFIALAIAFNEPTLITGVLPGNSKFNVDFKTKALPANGTIDNIYKGKITFTKKILWLINLTLNLTDKSLDNPEPMLSYDNYPGGFFPMIFNFGSSSVSGLLGSYSINVSMVDNFNFIPTPSALDIGSGSTSLVESDYLKKYTALAPPIFPKNSPFDNFTSSFNDSNDLNELHISFNELNGDWLAKELDDISNNEDLFDCSYTCDDINIEGSEFLCNSEIYNVDATASNFTWSITEGSHLVTMSGNGTSSITLNQVGSSSGQVKISVELSSDGYDCGDIDIDPIAIWVGLPKAYTQGFEPVICSGVLPDEDIYSLPISPGAETYELTSNSPFLTVAGGFVNPGEGVFMMATQPGNYTMTLTTTNDCGSKQSTIFVTAENCGGPGGLFSIYPNPATSELTIESSEEVESQNDILNKSSALKAKAKDLELSELYSYEIYDQFSALKQKGEFRELIKVNLTTLKKGLYLIKIKSKSYSEVYKFVIQ